MPVLPKKWTEVEYLKALFRATTIPNLVQLFQLMASTLTDPAHDMCFEMLFTVKIVYYSVPVEIPWSIVVYTRARFTQSMYLDPWNREVIVFLTWIQTRPMSNIRPRNELYCIAVIYRVGLRCTLWWLAVSISFSIMPTTVIKPANTIFTGNTTR